MKAKEISLINIFFSINTWHSALRRSHIRTVRSADAERNDLSIGETAKLRTIGEKRNRYSIELIIFEFYTSSYVLYSNEYIYYRIKINIGYCLK